MLESHGLFTWGDTAKECYETTIRIINQAIDWLESETAGKAAVRRRSGRKTLPAAERRAIAARLMPAIRGLISAGERKVGHFDDSRPCWSSSARRSCDELAALGTSCPDHFLRTKIRPLVVDFDPAKPDVDTTLAGLARGDRGLSRGLRRLLRALQACRLARPCATPTRSSIWCPASA